MDKKIDWWEIIAYVTGIGAIIFMVVMVILMVLR